MAQGPSDTILVAIRITLRIWESKVRNPDPLDRRRFVLCECILVIYVSSLLMFLLVPAHPGCPGQNPKSRKMVVCACFIANRACDIVMNVGEIVSQICCFFLRFFKLCEL